MEARVITRDGADVPFGTMVHMTSGPSIGQAWRLEKISHKPDGEHHLHVSRSVPKLGRVHKEFHPRMFGLEVVLDVRFYADKAKICAALRGMVAQSVLLTSGGVIAWAVGEYLNHRYGG